MCTSGAMYEPWLVFSEEKETPEDRVCNYSGLLSVEQYAAITEDEQRIEQELMYGGHQS